MIKKLLGLGIFALSFVSFCSSGHVGVIGQSSSSSYNSDFVLLVNGKGNILTKYFGYGKRIFMIDDGTYFFRSSDGLPYGSVLGYSQTQGFYDTYLLCDPISSLTGFQSPANCTKYSVDSGDNSAWKRILGSLNNGGLYYYDYASCGGSNPYYSFDLCFSSSEYNKSLCFFVGKNSNNNAISCATSLAYNYPNGNTSFFSNVSNSQNYATGFDQLSPSIFGSSPADPNGNNFMPGNSDVFSSGNTVDIPSDIDDFIEYYESRFGWNLNMCYVGTNDLDSVYGTPGLNFEYGTGATIYGLYYHLYSGFGSNKISNVGSFVNTWLMNYATWFQTPNDERLYIASYNGPDQNVTYIYTGFTPPFTDKPVAIYFMADLLSTQFVSENSQGEDIVFYCDMKLNYDNYKNGSMNFEETENLVNPKIKGRIKDYITYDMPGKNGYSYPLSGSIWDGLFQSGYNIPKDLNPTDLFADYFEKINGLFKDFNAVNSVGIIPRWILYPMLFLVLFRIIKH